MHPTLRPLLYRVSPRDMTVFVGVVMMLLVISLLATLLPASRVSKIDPVRALATECLYRPGPLRTTIAATA
jgi:hypothetical protein